MIASIFIILNLFLLECLLSVDNAAVLALMVRQLPERDHKKALRYGLVGAYVLRGACLLFASYLIHAWVLKLFGGAYLIYLAISHFKSEDSKENSGNEDGGILQSWISKLGIPKLLGTIILVELVDVSFSIDNIFASVSISDQYWVIIAGVFLGIASMRFIAGWFVNLINKYPSLEGAAFCVIAALGAKLIVSALAKGFEWSSIRILLESQQTDILFSISLLFVFGFSLLSRKKVIL